MSRGAQQPCLQPVSQPLVPSEQAQGVSGSPAALTLDPVGNSEISRALEHGTWAPLGATPVPEPGARSGRGSGLTLSRERPGRSRSGPWGCCALCPSLRALRPMSGFLQAAHLACSPSLQCDRAPLCMSHRALCLLSGWAGRSQARQLQEVRPALLQGVLLCRGPGGLSFHRGGLGGVIGSPQHTLVCPALA